MRAQIDQLLAARKSVAVCSLALASILLAGCNGSSTTSASASASSQPTPMVNKSADVTWMAPTTLTDGAALTDLAGYRIYYGTSPTKLIQSVDVARAGATDYVIQGLTQGTWYFAVVAYTNTGNQSAFSNIASKTIS